MFTKLFVGGLPFRCSNAELQALFAPIGTVVTAEMVFDPDRGRTRGFGFVQMSTPEEAQAAIAKLNGFVVAEKKIYVTQAREKPAPRDAAPRGEFRRIPNRKAGRPDRSLKYDQAADPGALRNRNPDLPSWPSGQKYSAGTDPTRPFRFDENRGPRREGRHARRYKGSRGRGPANGPTPPSGPLGRRSLGGGGSGFSKPNKWEPRGDDKRSFSPPRNEKGNFGPSCRAESGPGKSKFWKKFEKKRPL